MFVNLGVDGDGQLRNRFLRGLVQQPVHNGRDDREQQHRQSNQQKAVKGKQLLLDTAVGKTVPQERILLS